MFANNMIEPAFPSDASLIELHEKAADLREAIARMQSGVGTGAVVVLGALLRAMNSYYTNKIEGQHTLPADLELALKHEFSDQADIRRRQELAIAHIALEHELEPKAVAMAWQDHFHPDWLRLIHRNLFAELSDDHRHILDGKGQARGELVPGEFRLIDVTVNRHRAPPVDLLPELLRHWAFQYGNNYFPVSKKLLGAGAAMHRLTWIHPFADGNGRVTRLHSHLLLTHLGLTNGLWSPMRGMARDQDRYYEALAAADAPRLNDLDGRGNLSGRGLATYLNYWVDLCADQVGFMSKRLAFDELEHRFVSLALQFMHEFGRAAPPRRSTAEPHYLGRALHRLFLAGHMDRGEFKALLRVSDRTASRMLASLIDWGLVVSESRSGSLTTGLPFFSLKFLFPGLWTEAEGVVPEPSSL